MTATDIGYLQNMKALQDTACCHDAASAMALTDDAALVKDVSDPRFSHIFSGLHG